MKRVSFKVAKAIKNAGHPQELQEGTIFYVENGLMDKYDSDLYELFDPMYCTAPTYLEVWLWLWREKKYPISVEVCLGKWAYFEKETCVSNDGYIYNDPEEVIIAAIEYLVDNDLIK